MQRLTTCLLFLISASVAQTHEPWNFPYFDPNDRFLKIPTVALIYPEFMELLERIHDLIEEGEYETESRLLRDEISSCDINTRNPVEFEKLLALINIDAAVDYFLKEDYYIRRDAISDFILEQAKIRYGSKATKEDIFYYVYGILHSPDYRKTANDLKKMLPRLPLVEKQSDFQAFSEAGKALAKIHLEYEDQKLPKEVLINNKPMPKALFPDNQLL